MKVLQINSFFSSGGPPRIVNGIYDELIKNGDSCLVCASRGKPMNGIEYYRIGSTISPYLAAFEARIMDNDGFLAKKETKRLIEKIKNYQPDIIQLHNLHGYYIDIEELFRFLKIFDRPVVWTLHDCWAFTGHCSHFDYIGCGKWKSETCSSCSQKKDYPASFFLDKSKINIKKKKRAMQNVPNMTIVSVSKWLESQIKQSFLKKYNTVTIYNGIDTDSFKKNPDDKLIKKYGLENKKIVLGVANNWGKKKGLFDFFDLANELGDEYQVVMIGFENKLLNQLPSNILGIGKVNSIEELSKWYSSAYVFANLSYEETMGLVTVEAMACGTPVVVYNRTAVPEVVNESCGIVCSAGNIKEVVSAIKQMNKEEQQIIEYAKSFNMVKQYAEYLKLYEGLLR